MDLIDVFGIEFNNNSEKVDQISFLKLGRRKIRVKNCGFPPLDGTKTTRFIDLMSRRNVPGKENTILPHSITKIHLVNHLET